jgi:hypothetical protein
MSRGPGVWQRAILAELRERDWCEVTDVLPTPHTFSQYQAARRAAIRLARAGRAAYEAGKVFRGEAGRAEYRLILQRLRRRELEMFEARYGPIG